MDKRSDREEGAQKKKVKKGWMSGGKLKVEREEEESVY